MVDSLRSGKDHADYVAGPQCAGNGGSYVPGEDVGEGVVELASGESSGDDGVAFNSKMLG